MPRVELKLKNKGGTHTYTCSTCGKPVLPGQRYYTWARRFGRSGMRYFQHQDPCGYPRPTQLSSAKTAVIEEAQAEAHKEIDAWAPEFATSGVDAGDLTAILETLAGTVREIGEEYGESADNIEQNFDSSPTAEACRATQEECDGYADELESFSPQEDEPDIDEEASEEDQLAAFEEWVENVKTEARDAIDATQPSYQG